MLAFAEDLAQGIAALEAQYERYLHGVTETTGEAVTDLAAYCHTHLLGEHRRRRHTAHLSPVRDCPQLAGVDDWRPSGRLSSFSSNFGAPLLRYPRTRESKMIAVYVQPESLTTEQYNKARAGLDAAGATFEGRKHHSCFGEDGHLMVFEIWESQEAYDAFTPILFPVLQSVGITPKTQDVMQVVNLDQ